LNRGERVSYIYRLIDDVLNEGIALWAVHTCKCISPEIAKKSTNGQISFNWHFSIKILTMYILRFILRSVVERDLDNCCDIL